MPDESWPPSKDQRRGPIELWAAMFRQLTLRNILRVLPAWLGFIVGFVIAATGDTRGSTVQTVFGFVIAIPCLLVFAIQVGRMLLPLMRR